MERVKILESSTEESLGIEEAVCMKSVVRNWRDPTHHRKVKKKKKAYKLGEVVFSDGRESERNIVPIMTVQDNAVYGKVPYFIHVCREGKSERMSCRLITPKKKFDNFKTNYI